MAEDAVVFPLGHEVEEGMLSHLHTIAAPALSDPSFHVSPILKGKLNIQMSAGYVGLRKMRRTLWYTLASARGRSDMFIQIGKSPFLSRYYTALKSISSYFQLKELVGYEREESL